MLAMGGAYVHGRVFFWRKRMAREEARERLERMAFTSNGQHSDKSI